ncbi:hypothetical protein Tco_1082690 [Tanacetum coccineum]|uniref:Uncharacterized protein n=1 Tax=Tanacetum coccineum TaxID=301880 RepID=A0ABQ5I1E4_9ASTR
MGFNGIANMAIDPCRVWGDVEVMTGVRVWEIGNNGPSTRIYILHVKSWWCEKIKGLADLPLHGYMVFCKDGPCDGIMGLTVKSVMWGLGLEMGFGPRLLYKGI